MKKYNFINNINNQYFLNKKSFNTFSNISFLENTQLNLNKNLNALLQTTISGID